MSDPNTLLLKANLKQLKLPTMLAEHDQLAREATARNEPYEAYLLRLTVAEVAARTANAVAARIRAAAFPVVKELDAFDFTATLSVPIWRRRTSSTAWTAPSPPSTASTC